MVKMFVSEYAFNEALTHEETTELRRAYKAAGMEQFHSMNAATLERTHVSWFYSYYTAIMAITKYDNYPIAFVYVQPFIWDTDYYRNSRTTNKQANKWLREHGCDFSVATLRHVYANAQQGLSSCPLKMHDGTIVVPRFNASQITLDASGNLSSDFHCNEVPFLKYSSDYNELLADDKYVHFGNVCGLIER